MTTVETAPRPSAAEISVKTRYLVVDTESVPDGRLIADVKYPGEGLSPEDAIARAQAVSGRSRNTGRPDFPAGGSAPSRPDPCRHETENRAHRTQNVPPLPHP